MKKSICLVLALFFTFFLFGCKKADLITSGEYTGSIVYQSPIISSMVLSINIKIESHQLLIHEESYDLEKITLNKNFLDSILLEEDQALKDEFTFPTSAFHSVISDVDGLTNEYIVLTSKTNEFYIFYTTHNQEDEYSIFKVYKLEKDE